MTVHRSLRLLVMLALLSLSNPVANAQESVSIDPEAVQVLRKMSNYLGSLEEFTFRAENTIDTVMRSGQQLQLGAHVDISIQRPNRFRVNRKGDVVEQEFYFDGKTLTLYGKSVNYYATMTTSKTVDINSGLDLAKEEVGVIAPVSDLFYQDAYERLMKDVESGIYVGTSTVGGAEVHHLAFRGAEVDWQIWIEKGGRPLPKKYLITSKWIAGAPQFTAVFSDWNTSAKLNDALFRFSPPPGAEEIGFIPLRGGAASGAGGTK